MQLQKFNFHTHTYRCGHAVGDEHDYIKSAIDNGFTTLGISEHCGFEGFDDPTQRIAFLEMDKYKEDIDNIKDKYKEIEIFTGLEFEYFDDLNSYYDELKSKYDYLIIGQHAKDRKGYYYHDQCTDKDVRYMAYQICTALELGYSKYVAHPDYFMIGREDYSKECEKAIREIVQTAKKVGAVVELNLKGVSYGKKREYKGRPSFKYPHTRTIEIYKEENAEVVCGYDAHRPEFLSMRKYEEDIRKMVGDMNFLTDYKRLLSKNF